MTTATLDPGAVADRVADVRQRIAATGVDPDAVRLVAVTKGFGTDAVIAARQAGLEHLGENYADELVAKATAEPNASWHFLGSLQRNKAARLAPLVDVWEAIDRPAAAEAVARRSPGSAVFVQVNVAGDPAKHGCPPADTAALVERGRTLGLDVQGLMTVGPAGDRDGSRACFRALADLAHRLELTGLSMGMSDDYDVAVREGATTIRLGRALFGVRPTPARTQG